MARNEPLDQKAIRAALDELDQLSKAEYGCGLEALLLDASPESALRVQRIVGIVLKRPFAIEGPPPAYSRTGASRSWPWADDSPESQAASAPREFAILNELRMPGPWNERRPVREDGEVGSISWDAFRDDVENERGLFKVLMLYVDDRLKRRDRRSFGEYLEASESRRFEAGLDLATLLFDTTVTAPLLSLLGIPTLAVGIALVGIRYGYRTATDTNADRVGDAWA